MTKERRIALIVLSAVLAGAPAVRLVVAAEAGIRLDTYKDKRESAVRDLHIYSPWHADHYLNLSLPEHCWGRNLPNTSHDSREPISSPWGIAPDMASARYDAQPKPGVTFRARARVDSMAVNLLLEIANDTDSAITAMRALICLKPDRYKGAPGRPDAMSEFRDTSYARTWIAVDGQPVKLHDQTRYTGDYPNRGWTDIRSKINWGVNVKGMPDNRVLPDMSWFRGNSPGRIVEEVAWPPVMAVQAEDNPNHWLAIIWKPAHVMFCNPQNPCFHSDPKIADCPAHGTTRVEGVVFFHEGTIESLIARAQAWWDARR
ncbi:MAG TPA: hypothetical protein VJ417_01760 [Candidatus Glassbacteria bacterium]|nr:hypothetical protein [Candidatus Glassbacteria bacterium]